MRIVHVWHRCRRARGPRGEGRPGAGNNGGARWGWAWRHADWLRPRAQDIAAMTAIGVDVQVGMALYTGAFDLAEGFCASLKSDRADGLWPTIVADPGGRALGLVYSNLDSVRASIERRRRYAARSSS